MFARHGHSWDQSITLITPTTKEQALLRNAFALFKEDSIQCLLEHLRASESIVTDENVGWFEDGFSEPFRPYFIPSRVRLQKCVMDCILIIVKSTFSKNCEKMLIKVLSHILFARSNGLISPELTPNFSEFLCQFTSSPAGQKLLLRTQQEYNLKWFLMEFLVNHCQPSSDDSKPSQIILTRPLPLLNSVINEINSRFSIHDLSQYLSTPPDLTTFEDKDLSTKTDLAFDVLFLSLLSIVSDEELHKPARRLLAHVFQVSEGELERLLLEREVRCGDLEMDWQSNGRQKEDTLSFADGVWMLLERRETELERDENTNETDTKKEREEDTEHEPENVEYPRKVRNNSLRETTSTSTVFLHRMACLLISALLSAASNCLPSNHQPTASTGSNHIDTPIWENTVAVRNNRTLSESHLFRICLKLTGWLPTTFEILKSGSVLTTTVRMVVESTVSLVFLLLPHADLDWQCFLVFHILDFADFTEMMPRVITPDLVRKVAIFFARLSPSLPPKLARSVEFGLRWTTAKRGPEEIGTFSTKAAELCRPILSELASRLEREVEGRREILAQIWVIVSSNDCSLLGSCNPLVSLLSVLPDATDDEVFFILRACIVIVRKTDRDFDALTSVLIEYSSLLIRLGKQIDRLGTAVEAWRVLLELIYMIVNHPRDFNDDPTIFVRTVEEIAVTFGETVGRVLEMLRDILQTCEGVEDINEDLHVLGAGLDLFQKLFKHIDFSPLRLSLLPALTSLQPFFGFREVLFYVYHELPLPTASHAFNPSPFHFIPMLSSFPTEQSVFDDILRSQIANCQSMIRFGSEEDERVQSERDQSERDRMNIETIDYLHKGVRVRMALECAIRLPRLLHTSIPFHRARQAQIEQGEDRNWRRKLSSFAESLFFGLRLDLLADDISLMPHSFSSNVDLISWALTGGNRRDGQPATNEEDWSGSEGSVSWLSNVEFAVMWMLKGMVEFSFSGRRKVGCRKLPILWKMMLLSILFRTPFHHSIQETCIRLRVCLWEEGVEDVIGAVECQLDTSLLTQFGQNNDVAGDGDGDAWLKDLLG